MHLKDTALICNALKISCVTVCTIRASTNRIPWSKLQLNYRHRQCQIAQIQELHPGISDKLC